MSRLLRIHINCLKKLDEDRWSENWTFSRHVHQKLIDKGLAKRAIGTVTHDGQIHVNTTLTGKQRDVYKRTIAGSTYLAYRAQRQHKKGRLS